MPVDIAQLCHVASGILLLKNELLSTTAPVVDDISAKQRGSSVASEPKSRDSVNVKLSLWWRMSVLQTLSWYGTAVLHDHTWVRRLPVCRLGIACHGLRAGLGAV